jgi:hypothetical protein
MSDEHYLEIDTPNRLVQESVDDVGFTNPVGFLSNVTLQLWSKCGQKMFDIAMNEVFTGIGRDMTNDWGGAPPTSNWSKMNGYTFTDGIGFACSGCTPAPEWPGPLQTPPKSLSTTKVKWHAQEFRSGSATSGNGVLVQADTQQLYVDHGRQENVTTPVN